MNEEATEVTLLVIKALDKLGIPYLIGGSLASSIYGMARSTVDTDLVAEVKVGQAEQLEQELKDDFYVTTEEIEQAIKHRGSFNVIHLATTFKVDLFIPKGRTFDENQFKNRRLVTVASNPDRSAYVAGAEDVVLAKLDWYRLGNEVSERQWSDIIGVIKVQGSRLNVDYLRQQAAELLIGDLLERALRAI